MPGDVRYAPVRAAELAQMWTAHDTMSDVPAAAHTDPCNAPDNPDETRFGYRALRP